MNTLLIFKTRRKDGGCRAEAFGEFSRKMAIELERNFFEAKTTALCKRKILLVSV
jgi:hypothetical protein